MKLKFEQFNTEIVDPTVTVKSVNDNIEAKQCSVEVLLSTDTAKFGVQLDGFTYTTTWEDADIKNWLLNVELPKYEI